MRSTWTDEDDAKLRELLEQGLSYFEVSEALGRTRNACIGRGHRIGIMTKTDPAIIDAKRARWSRKKPERQKKEPLAEALVIPFPLTVTTTEPRYEQPLANETAFGQPKSINGLSQNHCRWPVHRSLTSDRWLFCAANRREKSSYCAEHHLLAYVKPRNWA